MSNAFDVHVVPHTHWDREWYHPAGRFRQRLVALVDELLDAPPAAGESFLLDGQAVVLEDFLAVRPEREGELSHLLHEGALEAGPWYVLADELIPGAEALVRNLLAGRRALHALGAEPPPVLYSPDAFGHPAALPTLAAGFGCELVILWRGFGGRRWPDGDACVWRAPDGSAALLYHLPPDGYEFGSSLPAGDDQAELRWLRARAVLAPRARLDLLLVQNGADHHARQRQLDEALRALRRAALPDHVVRSSLRTFAAAALRAAARVTLPEVGGELRDSYGYTWTLQGTFATRAHQKRRNAHAERLLVRDAEPWAALARRIGGKPRHHLAAAAWKTLLLCHPHDTLCGCSADEVARAMDTRLDDALTQARGFRDDALLDLLGHDPADARVRRDEWRSAVVVRNAAPRRRGGVAEVELVTFVRDVPVGPGSSSAPGADAPPRAVSIEDGAVPVQLLERGWRHDRIESPRHYPDNDLVEVRHAVAWVPPMGGYSVTALRLTDEPDVRAVSPASGVRAGRRSIENDHLGLVVERGGRLRLLAPRLGIDIADFVHFESTGDHGDLYTPSLRGEMTVARFSGAKVVHRGPLRATIEARWTLSLPLARAVPEADVGASAASSRSGRVTVPVSARFTLDAEAPFLRIAVSGTNTARDHRLRVVVATGVAKADVYADAAFGPVRRVPLDLPPEDTVRETPPPTAPLHRYVSLYGPDRGATLFSDGLAEYEALAGGALAVTLVRAVGELSRANLPERPGHAGWPLPTPEAQSRGPFAAELALMPHGPRDRATLDAVERTADDVLLPLTGTTLRSALTLPPPSAGVELRGEALALSTVKESESGEWLVVRCVNVSDGTVAGEWQFGLPVSEARLARLDETPLSALTPRGGLVPFTAPPRGVVTVLVRFGPPDDDRSEVGRAELTAQLRRLGVQDAGVLLVHTSYRAVRPVEGGPGGLIAALRDALGPGGTLVMPSWGGDDDAPFDAATTPAARDLGVVADTFWRLPGVVRSAHFFAFAAAGPAAARITADPLPLPPHQPASPVGRVHELDGQVLLLGVGHDANTTLHLAELLAGVPYRAPKHCTVLGPDRRPVRVDYGENDHCCQRFALADEWLRARGLQREGRVGHATARLLRARDVTAVACEHLARDPLVFLHAAGSGCVECEEARQSVGGAG